MELLIIEIVFLITLEKVLDTIAALCISHCRLFLFSSYRGPLAQVNSVHTVLVFICCSSVVYIYAVCAQRSSKCIHALLKQYCCQKLVAIYTTKNGSVVPSVALQSSRVRSEDQFVRK